MKNPRIGSKHGLYRTRKLTSMGIDMQLMHAYKGPRRMLREQYFLGFSVECIMSPTSRVISTISRNRKLKFGLLFNKSRTIVSCWLIYNLIKLTSRPS